MTPPIPPRTHISMTEQPSIRPIFCWRPDRVSGIPIMREIRPFKADSPLARFHDHEKPKLLRRAIIVLLIRKTQTGSAQQLIGRIR
jgi:hypothetical protein